MSRKILVTGGGKGIGLEVVKRFYEQGDVVFIFFPDKSDISPAFPKSLVNHLIKVDFRCVESIEFAFEELFRFTNRVDVLINNAGIFPRSDFGDISLEGWYDVINVNLTSAFLCSQRVVKLMKHKGVKHIINVSSDAAFLGPKSGAHYAASKAGLIGLSKSMSNSLAALDINVNVVVPGVTDTDQAGLTSSTADFKSRSIPKRRVANVADIAKVILSLTSGDFDYVTGQKFLVDGGRSPI